MARMSPMPRFTGRSGEKRFSLLCSDLGITCNESVEDEHGWDHVLEFPHAALHGIPADLQHRLPPVFVQTKSHPGGGRSVRMKLSNAVSLALSPNPCFVVLMTLVPGSVTPTWHAAHIWGPLLKRIMKRAREESRDGLAVEEFHTRTFGFTMTEENLQEERKLLPWIERTIRSVGRDYAAAKAALSPPPALVGELKIGPLGSVAELMDHMIGLTTQIPVESVTMGQRRFGVDIPFPIPEGDIVFASLRSHPAGTCQILLRGPDGVQIECVGDVIAPPDLGLPEEAYKYRFRAPNLDIIWSLSGQATIEGGLDFQHADTPEAIARALRLMSWAGQGPVDVQVSVRDQPLLRATATIDAVDDRQAFADLAAVTEALVGVSRHLKTNPPLVSIAQISKAEHVGAFHDFINTSAMQMTIELPADAVVPKLAAGLGFGLLPVGDWMFGAVQRFPIVASIREGATLSIEYGKPIVLDTFAFPVGDASALERFKESYRRHVTGADIIALDNVLVILGRQGTA